MDGDASPIIGSLKVLTPNLFIKRISRERQPEKKLAPLVKILRCLQVFISKLLNEPMRFMSDVSDKGRSTTGFRRNGRSWKINHIVADTLGSNRSDNTSHTLSAIVKSITATAIARSPNAATREPVQYNSMF